MLVPEVETSLVRVVSVRSTCQVKVMTILRFIALGAALASVSSMAYAFQEQGAPAQPGATAPSMSMSAPNLPIRGTGTEIRIPGLGPIGTMPKFDFGLELLYGAGEPKGVREEMNKSEPSDLQIRGTLKYRFPN